MSTSFNALPTADLLDRAGVAAFADEQRREGRSIVFTNGCFDILHPGHVRYLNAARREGDCLIVGLNSDASVHRIKGEKRPVNPQMHRAEVLVALACVDAVTLFDEPDPEALIRAVRPHVLVKGADWAESDIVGSDFVRSLGGRVVRVPVVPEISTTGIIERILRLYGFPAPEGGP